MPTHSGEGCCGCRGGKCHNFTKSCRNFFRLTNTYEDVSSLQMFYLLLRFTGFYCPTKAWIYGLYRYLILTAMIFNFCDRVYFYAKIDDLVWIIFTAFFIALWYYGKILFKLKILDKLLTREEFQREENKRYILRFKKQAIRLMFIVGGISMTLWVLHTIQYASWEELKTVPKKYHPLYIIADRVGWFYNYLHAIICIVVTFLILNIHFVQLKILGRDLVGMEFSNTPEDYERVVVRHSEIERILTKSSDTLGHLIGVGLTSLLLKLWISISCVFEKDSTILNIVWIILSVSIYLGLLLKVGQINANREILEALMYKNTTIKQEGRLLIIEYLKANQITLYVFGISVTLNLICKVTFLFANVGLGLAITILKTNIFGK